MSKIRKDKTNTRFGDINEEATEAINDFAESNIRFPIMSDLVWPTIQATFHERQFSYWLVDTAVNSEIRTKDE